MLFNLSWIKIPLLTPLLLCGIVCVTGGDTDGEVYVRRDYVWREVQH